MKKSRKTHSTDALMQKTALMLLRDFQTNLNDPCFCSEYQLRLRTGSIAQVREVNPAPTDTMDVALYKATYQVQSLMKRYRFRNDTYSDQELFQKAIQGFRDTQDRLASVDLDSLPAFSQAILNLAARYVAQVLGPYSDEEHRNLCRFGRRASVGIPSRKACEAARWELPISGSREQISWFDSEMSQVACVQDYWAKQLESDPNRSIYQEKSSLRLTLVPKTFKSLRAIMPNTTIGSYMSFGIGEMIRKRLKRKGYDISSLQMKHRSLARLASINNLYVTADLSSASDSITDALVKRLFPTDWYKILCQSRIGTVDLPDGSSIESLTFCTMGIGYTFPLQTLVFLSLLKAIEAAHYDRLDRRTISVYGDDMIYSSRMHHLVVQYFEQFGFVINLDKTYHDGHFRESCGGDYYHGVDVRPFQPQNGQAIISSRAYEAVLYKFINGLLMRWSEYEIGGTLDYLTSELEAVTGKCKLVPCDFADDAGIKTPFPAPWDFLRRAKVAFPKHIGHGLFRFSYLKLKFKLRKEDRHVPYYWNALRGGPQPELYVSGSAPRRPDNLGSRLFDYLGLSESICPLLEEDGRPIGSHSLKNANRRRRLSTFLIDNQNGRYTRQSGVSGFEDRR